MKLLIDARMVAGHHGIGRYTKSLIDGLIALNHEVSILSSSIETDNVFSRGSLKSIIRCNLPFAHPAECLELSFKIPKTGFDLVHLPSFAVPIKLPSIPLVVTIHDLIHLEKPSFSHSLYYKNIVKRAVNHAAVITVSEWAKKEISRKLKIDHDKVRVVRNGLEPVWFTKSHSVLTTIPTFVCLSNLKTHKNIETLLKASRDLWRQGHNFRLELSLGGKDLPPQWEPLKTKINIIKNASDEEILKTLQSSWGLISPSYYEGFDYPVAQALAQGKPVILSKGSAHDEFRGSQALIYGEPGDSGALKECIKRVIAAPPRLSFDHNILTQQAMVAETIKVYEGVVFS